MERSYDRRWIKCKRPFIVSGGELTMDMLDLRYNATSSVYEAPFQLKANNGIYLIDDFGRQIAKPGRSAEPLDRPDGAEGRLPLLHDRRQDDGPFEAFLVFSTNLNPVDLGDDAFLRRIQYKMLLRGPGQNEFVRIFESFCAARRISLFARRGERFIEKHYPRRAGDAAAAIRATS